jgi:hypothetical protein
LGDATIPKKAKNYSTEEVGQESYREGGAKKSAKKASKKKRRKSKR